MHNFLNIRRKPFYRWTETHSTYPIISAKEFVNYAVVCFDNNLAVKTKTKMGKIIIFNAYAMQDYIKRSIVYMFYSTVNPVYRTVRLFYSTVHLFYSTVPLFYSTVHLFYNTVHLFYSTVHLFYNTVHLFCSKVSSLTEWASGISFPLRQYSPIP